MTFSEIYFSIAKQQLQLFNFYLPLYEYYVKIIDFKNLITNITVTSVFFFKQLKKRKKFDCKCAMIKLQPKDPKRN